MNFYRKVYKLVIILKSPMSVGSGANENTDKDIVVDSVGNPFIPATSLAGVLRNYIETKYNKGNEIFGFITENDSDNKKDSLIRVYDALYTGKKNAFFITNRDMVTLKNKVAETGAKFDMEAVETGAEFTAYLELPDQEYANIIEDALEAMNAGIIRIGSKTTRGYGEVSLNVYSKEFSDIASWIDFDMISDQTDWGEPLDMDYKGSCQIILGLKLNGGISIREYTTEVAPEGETAPDYRQLALHIESESGDAVPVIPGTSWAGAFRERFTEFGDKDAAKALFGYVTNRKDSSENPEESESETKKSVIVFSESQLSGGVWKKTTRNAIDRFTGGTKDGALYTEETYYGGETELSISFREDPSEDVLNRIVACLADLHNGLLAVGGLTSVGRGLFEIVSVNGKALSPDEKKPENIFSAIRKEVAAE